MKDFCMRHEAALQTAIAIRGLACSVGFDPVEHAAQIIVNHASHAAGKSAVVMLTERRCPLCFVNHALSQNAQSAHVVVDDWVDHAAEETLELDLKRADQPCA